MTLALPLLVAALSMATSAPAAAASSPVDAWLPVLPLLGVVAVAAWMVFRLRARLAALQARNSRLTARNAELRVLAGRAEAKARQLDGAMAAMSDGIMVTDAELRLVGWNTRFPDYAGVPRQALRIGLPIREVLRLQAEAGEFGLVDPEMEADRRLALLREGPLLERWVRDRPDGSRLELRRAPLPGGGYVTLYTPVRDPDGGPAPSLAEAFRAEWRGRLPRLTAAAADGDTPGARQVAHALRGIAGNAGWPAVAGVLAAVEAAAEAGDVTELRLLTALLPVEPPSTV